MRGLKGTLYATNPDTGETHTFGPGTGKDDLPGWVKVDDGAFEADDSDDADTAVAGGVGSGPSDNGGSGGEDGSSSAYGSLKKGQLQEEIDNRNAERDPDDQIQVGGNGNVKDLRAALEADDEAQRSGLV